MIHLRLISVSRHCTLHRTLESTVRKESPLKQRGILAIWDAFALDGTVTDETNSAYSSVSTKAGHAHIPAKKVATGKSDLPCRRSGAAESGMGWYDNRHLNYLVKSILMNTGDCPRNGDDNPSVKQGQSRCRHSSPRMGEPTTRRRATVCWKVLSKCNRVLTWRNCIHEYR